MLNQECSEKNDNQVDAVAPVCQDEAEPVCASNYLEQALADIKLGHRDRGFWRKILAQARRNGIARDQLELLVAKKVFSATKTTEEKQAIASEIGVDWEGLADFMEALMPIILEMMAACGA